VGRQGDFKTVFAGVAAARHIQVSAVHIKSSAGHEHQFFDTRQQALQSGHGLWALQGQQGAVKLRRDGAAAANALLDVGQIAVFAGTVDDHKNIATVGHIAVHEHQVVDDAALVIEQQAVALFVHAQAHHVHRHQALEGGCRVWPAQAQLAHVRDIEQASAVRVWWCSATRPARGIAPACCNRQKAPCGRPAQYAMRSKGW
jgi:hypothetical protein